MGGISEPCLHLFFSVEPSHCSPGTELERPFWLESSVYEYRRNQPRFSGEMFHAKATNGVFQMKYLIAAILVSVSIVEAQSPVPLSLDGRPTTVSVAAGAATKRTFYSVIK